MVQLNKKGADFTRTPQETVGPYLTLGLLSGDKVELKDNNLTSHGGSGQEITIRGHLFDSQGAPLFNVMVEIWQANSQGVFNHPAYQDREGFDPDFVGFGRDVTDERGAYQFKTFKPGKIHETDHPEFSQAPHVLLFVHASGVGYPLYTRVYFEDEEHEDNFSQRLTQAEHQSLIARRVEEDDQIIYEFDMVLQGEAEELVLESKLSGEEVEDLPDGSGKPATYFFHFV
ncbi:protocatechuate 3,4-dioxygenase subunit alpha [Hutsoniella sourekii]|uniref:protocatechuate 3,4-dioxygenase subunit alpha n=1 Tax=Hutsoniella sourekii TaxID=87650 RepID=UPI0004B77F1C|nr:protocatechuate 3,4-dioxygenase subunit alpha [Hutsoniella sourekii]